MIRKIIKIDEEKCNGCGLCAQACHEGAIGMVNGKAKLLRDDYCDGLGDCLPVCPTDAISFEEREAAEYDREAVEANMTKRRGITRQQTHHSGCPGSVAKSLSPENTNGQAESNSKALIPSALRQWPVQIKLAPVNAPYFENADLLIAADCTAYAYGSFHSDFMKNNIVLIGCPKLDDIDYSQKLKAIISSNSINGITVARMEVPCCGGMEAAVRKAIEQSGKNIPLKVVTIGINGKLK